MPSDRDIPPKRNSFLRTFDWQRSGQKTAAASLGIRRRAKHRPRRNSPFRGAKFSERKGQPIAKASNRVNWPLFHARAGSTFTLQSCLVPWSGTDDPWPRPPRRLPVWSVRVSGMSLQACSPVKFYHPTRIILVIPICGSDNRSVTRNFDLDDRYTPASVDRNWPRNCSSCRKCRLASVSILAPWICTLDTWDIAFSFVFRFPLSFLIHSAIPFWKIEEFVASSRLLSTSFLEL